MFGAVGAGAGWGVGHVGLVVAGVALAVHPPRHGVPTRCRPQSMGDTQIRLPVGGGLSPSGVARRGRVVWGDVEGGVEEEVSDAFPQGGRLDQGGRPDAGAGAGGVEAQHDVVFPESPEVLPYRCGVV